MNLESPDGRFFSLTVEGYQFPDEELGPSDDNPVDEFETGRFLTISCRFHDQGPEWGARGATMTTTELQRFRDWLSAICRGESPDSNGVYFTERDLEFSVDMDLSELRVHASWNFLPGWETPGSTVSIRFALSDLNLEQAVEDLDKDLARFPGRPDVNE